MNSLMLRTNYVTLDVGVTLFVVYVHLTSGDICHFYSEVNPYTHHRPQAGRKHQATFSIIIYPPVYMSC